MCLSTTCDTQSIFDKLQITMDQKKAPVCILLFSGKRKSGKDYLTEELVKTLRTFTDLVVIKISAPIKSHFATAYNLTLDDLMGSGEYKEKYRKDMITWSDSERARDPGTFCRQAVKMYEAESKPVWIVSDVRRKTDIAWFQAMYDDVVKTVRIEADQQTRHDRGFVHTEGVDNVTSECDLDDVHSWDWVIDNSSGSDSLSSLQSIVAHVRNAVASS